MDFNFFFIFFFKKHQNESDIFGFLPSVYHYLNLFGFCIIFLKFGQKKRFILYIFSFQKHLDQKARLKRWKLFRELKDDLFLRQDQKILNQLFLKNFGSQP